MLGQQLFWTTVWLSAAELKESVIGGGEFDVMWLVGVELKDAVIGGEFGSSRDPSVLDRRFRNIQNIVSQSRGYVFSFYFWFKNSNITITQCQKNFADCVMVKFVICAVLYLQPQCHPYTVYKLNSFFYINERCITELVSYQEICSLSIRWFQMWSNAAVWNSPLLGSGNNITVFDGSYMYVTWTASVRQNALYLQNVRTVGVVHTTRQRSNRRAIRSLPTFLHIYPDTRTMTPWWWLPAWRLSVVHGGVASDVNRSQRPGPSNQPSEGARFHSHPLLWTSLQPPKLLNGINVASLRIGILVIHMLGSTEHLQSDNTATSVGNGIGPETSASQWHKYAMAILRWQQLTCTVSGVRTRPSAHTVKAPKKQWNIWCSNAWPTIRPGGTRGLETALQQTHDASGATRNGLGRRPALPTGNETEREDQDQDFVARTRTFVIHLF